jgi:biotin transporter BioY
LDVRGGQRIHLLAAVGGYVIGGVSAGFVVGLLKPLTRRRIGSFFVGTLTGFAVALALGSVLVGFPPTSEDLLVAAIFAVALGGTVGAIYHGIFYDDASTTQGESR